MIAYNCIVYIVVNDFVVIKCCCCRNIFSGLLDSITSTADSKDCPGVCVHTLATLICYEVLENVNCPNPSMRCCVEPPPLPANGTATAAVANKVDQTTPAIASNTKPQVSKDAVCRPATQNRIIGTQIRFLVIRYFVIGFTRCAQRDRLK